MRIRKERIPESYRIPENSANNSSSLNPEDLAKQTRIKNKLCMREQFVCSDYLKTITLLKETGSMLAREEKRILVVVFISSRHLLQ